MSSPMEEWNRIVEQASKRTGEDLRRAIEELIETLDEQQRCKSEGLNRDQSEVHNFPPHWQTSVDSSQVNDNAKPCPHCRNRGRDARGNTCKRCAGTGVISPNQAA